MNVASSLRVLVVDDDPAYRRILSHSLRRVGVHDVFVAGDLAVARTKIERDAVDVVTIDVVLRGESGLDLLTYLRWHHPEIVTVLITAGTQAQASRAVDGLLLGAAALIVKPAGPGAAEDLDRALAQALADIAPRGAAPARPRTQPIARAPIDAPAATAREVIAVGASTGGPPAVLALLDALPADLRTPIVIAQHMPALHVPHFASLLAERSGRAVAVAGDGEAIGPGRVYVAPGGRHLRITRAAGRLVLVHDDGPEEHNCKPAVDPLFRSVAATCGAAAIGVILTGMGADGAAGAIALREAGAAVAAQDRASSVVWGMPGAVVARGAAHLIAPVPDIARWIASLDAGAPWRTR